MNVRGLSEKVASNLVEKQGVTKAAAFDPTIIAVIAEVIKMVFEGLKECNLLPQPNPTPTPTPTPKDVKLQATGIMNDPNAMHRFLLRRYIVRAGVDKKMREQVYGACLDTGKGLKNQDLIEVKQDLNFDLV